MIPFSKQQLISYLRDHSIHLTKKRGQNFLIDKNILRKLIVGADISSSDLVIEVGGGLGHLTSYILETGASVIVFEVDFKLAELLKANFKGYKNVRVICGDFLKVDLDRYISSSVKILANIPYYITSGILERCFKYMHFIDSMVFTVQKEFAERVIAIPSSSGYGALSVFCQVHSTPRVLFEVSENVFFPIPRVRSSVVRFDRAKRFEIFNSPLFFSIVRSIFSYRRKTILNSLCKSPYLSFDRDFIIFILGRCSIDINLRGEELAIVKLVELANSFSKCSYK